MTRTPAERLRQIDPSPIRAAEIGGLRYTTDRLPGIERRGAGKRARYYDARGRRIRDRDRLARIASLAVPPAWVHVWISPFADGHLQATGRDARGRKQYRYHPRWRAIRDQTKYDRLIIFAQALPRLRARVAQDLALRGMPREKVMAVIVRLLETTFIRIGNDEYARQNRSFGLTTLRNRHVSVRGSCMRFRFRGKSGISRDTAFSDRRLAQIVRRCQELPGQELFGYLDERNRCRAVTSSDVNDYLRAAVGVELSAKDFRTWAGTVLAAIELGKARAPVSKADGKRSIVRAIEQVARELGNTRAVCRKSYIHPAILDSYLDGTLEKMMPRQQSPAAADPCALTPQEAAVKKLLERAAAGLDGKKAA